MLYQYLSSTQFCCGRKTPTECIHCRECRTGVAFVDETALLMALTRPSRFIREGRLEKDSLSNEGTNEQKDLGANGRNDDQDGDANEQDLGANNMRLDELICWNDVTLLHLLSRGHNEQPPNDQDGDANEQVPSDQDLGANDQNVDQDGDANEQDLGTNEQNAYQDGDPKEQDLGANANQDGDGNKRDLEKLLFKMEIELITMKAQLMKMKLQLIKMERQLLKMEGPLLDLLLIGMNRNDQDGDAIDQDEGTTDQDGDAPMN
ncbi:hypothetical protein H5410_062259 [Solanum commersonii]|uniref:Uncharacterized protein n=1 Tax=Solanum commersonii TaxID=4109 RepID=A0A9J5WAC2_SOLCO|nr:hypothetical protein H5410_062259 [Solanum commersonii]